MISELCSGSIINRCYKMIEKTGTLKYTDELPDTASLGDIVVTSSGFNAWLGSTWATIGTTLNTDTKTYPRNCAISNLQFTSR